MAHMRDNGIAATPQNFMLWYHYCSGEHAEIKRTIDALLAIKGMFDDELSEDLFETFFGNAKQQRATQDASYRMLQTLSEALNEVSLAGEGARRYGDALHSFSGGVKDAPSPAAITDLLHNIVAETRAMAERNSLLERHLAHSSEQIRDLQTTLEEVRREALTDSLTGIANRREFERKLKASAAEAIAAHQDLCLIIADIDHFKVFNDAWGHQLGDQVLRLVARTITAGIKGQDTAARFGGEEFAIILPRTRLNDATLVALHIRDDVAAGQLIRRSTGEAVGRVALSLGVARYRPGEPLAEFVARADAALYLAKERGRNQVVAEGALQQAP